MEDQFTITVFIDLQGIQISKFNHREYFIFLSCSDISQYYYDMLFPTV